MTTTTFKLAYATLRCELTARPLPAADITALAAHLSALPYVGEVIAPSMPFMTDWVVILNIEHPETAAHSNLDDIFPPLQAVKEAVFTWGIRK